MEVGYNCDRQYNNRECSEQGTPTTYTHYFKTKISKKLSKIKKYFLLTRISEKSHYLTGLKIWTYENANSNSNPEWWGGPIKNGCHVENVDACRQKPGNRWDMTVNSFIWMTLIIVYSGHYTHIPWEMARRPSGAVRGIAPCSSPTILHDQHKTLMSDYIYFRTNSWPSGS